MCASAPDSRPPHHEFALELERARREAGLKPKELASKLFVHPRSVRRYLNGERLPTIETTEAWERACNIEAGRLSRLHPDTVRGGRNSRAASAAEEATPDEAAEITTGSPTGSRWLVPTVAALAMSMALVVFFPRGGDEPDLREAAEGRPTSVAYHRFTASYVGDVWIRITPTRQHAGEPHGITLRWGPLMQEVDLRRLHRPRTLFTGKNRPDRVTLQVNVKPAASIAFGEGNVPVGALDINPGWTKGG